MQHDLKYAAIMDAGACSSLIVAGGGQAESWNPAISDQMIRFSLKSLQKDLIFWRHYLIWIGMMRSSG